MLRIIKLLLIIFGCCCQIGSAQVRLVSLVPDTTITVDFGGEHRALHFLEHTPYFEVESGVHELNIASSGEQMLKKRLGFVKKERALMVIFGNAGSEPKEGFIQSLRTRFEGQGHTSTKNYALQAKALRGRAYLDPKKAYLRVFHGALATVPISIHCGSRQASAEYAEVTDFLPVEPGNRQVEILAGHTTSTLFSRELTLEAGTTTYLFLARTDGGKGELRAISFSEEFELHQ